VQELRDLCHVAAVQLGNIHVWLQWLCKGGDAPEPSKRAPDWPF
jgi:type II secretory pathway component PulL